MCLRLICGLLMPLFFGLLSLFLLPLAAIYFLFEGVLRKIKYCVLALSRLLDEQFSSRLSASSRIRWDIAKAMEQDEYKCLKFYFETGEMCVGTLENKGEVLK